MLKLNSDASVLRSTMIGLGAIVRDTYGFMVVVGAHRIVERGVVMAAEAWALRFGLELLARVPRANVVLESDSLGLIQRFQAPCRDLSYFGVSLQGNSVAHMLSRWLESGSEDVVLFVDVIPDAITL
ncbi:hypothetical protein V2J09_017841 [Rumex salicifolius]